MEIREINSGGLRATGCDARARLLQARFDDGSMLQYCGVGEDTWHRFSGSGAAWSFYRDNIEAEADCLSLVSAALPPPFRTERGKVSPRELPSR